ncbi:MAG: phosphoribosylglycinamide formyltransferase [Candidatus Sumerlaeia bacterium]|nr:phosphoribosylglycinamide formyltransferase [Candidatus Sumerlaeia bacterium]
MPLRTAVLASGSGTNFEALAEAHRQGMLAPAELVVVICNVPGAGVLDRARAAGVETLVIPHRDFASREAFEKAMVSALRERGTALVVLAGFMRVLTPAFLQAFPQRVINLHPALLPSFPGADGVGDALAHGVKVTGVTVHFVDAGVDTGPIILQEALAIAEGETREQLAARLRAIEHRLLPHAVQLVAAGRTRVEGRRVIVSEEMP